MWWWGGDERWGVDGDGEVGMRGKDKGGRGSVLRGGPSMCHTFLERWR